MKSPLVKKPTRMQMLAAKLLRAKTRDQAESILGDMDSLSKRLNPPFGDSDLEQAYLGFRDEHEDWERVPGDRTTMKEAKDLARYFLKG